MTHHDRILPRATGQLTSIANSAALSLKFAQPAEYTPEAKDEEELGKLMAELAEKETTRYRTEKAIQEEKKLTVANSRKARRKRVLDALQDWLTFGELVKATGDSANAAQEGIKHWTENGYVLETVDHSEGKLQKLTRKEDYRAPVIPVAPAHNARMERKARRGKIIRLITKQALPPREIIRVTGLDRYDVLSDLRCMAERGTITKTGKGRAAVYHANNRKIEDPRLDRHAKTLRFLSTWKTCREVNDAIPAGRNTTGDDLRFLVSKGLVMEKGAKRNRRYRRVDV